MKVTRREAIVALIATIPGAGAACARDEAAPLPQLRRGVNFHHVLNWPEVIRSGGSVEYVWPPFADPSHQLRKSDLERVKSLGFDFVRLTADPGLLLASDGQRRRELLDHASAVVAAILAAGLQVVFDLHPVAVNPAYRPAALMEAGLASPFEAYLAMISAVAARLAGFPRERVTLELFNEPPLASPSDEPRWQVMLERLHRTARLAAPVLPLMLGGARWNDRLALMRLDVAPFRESAVLFTFHYYDPHLFTHQGVEAEDTAFVSGLVWPVNASQAAAALEQTERAIGASSQLSAEQKDKLTARARRETAKIVEGRFDHERVDRDFAEVGAWARREGISPGRIVVGEFGCVLQSRSIPLGLPRLAWLEAVRSAAEREGFAWAYWAYKGYGGMELVTGGDELHRDLIAPLGLNS